MDGDEERQRRIAAALGNLPDFPSCHPNDSLACAHKTYAGDKKLPILLAGSEEGMAEAVCKVEKHIGALKKGGGEREEGRNERGRGLGKGDERDSGGMGRSGEGGRRRGGKR